MSSGNAPQPTQRAGLRPALSLEELLDLLHKRNLIEEAAVSDVQSRATTLRSLVVKDRVGSVRYQAAARYTVTPAEIVAASESAWLERICETDPCGLELVSRADGDRHRLPDSFVHPDDTWSVSPDGDHVVRVTPAGSAEIYTVSLPGVSWVTGRAAGGRRSGRGGNVGCSPA